MTSNGGSGAVSPEARYAERVPTRESATTAGRFIRRLTKYHIAQRGDEVEFANGPH